MRVILNVPDIQIRPSRRSPSSDHVHAPESVSSGDHAAAVVASQASVRLLAIEKSSGLTVAT